MLTRILTDTIKRRLAGECVNGRTGEREGETEIENGRGGERGETDRKKRYREGQGEGEWEGKGRT